MTIAVWDRDALVPVTLTATVPPEAKVQDNVENPDPVTVDGVTVQAELLAVRLTTPLNPF